MMKKLKERAKRLQTDMPAVFLSLKDKDTPAAARIAALITVCYALSPIDLAPDFIPVLGYLDDMIILPVLIALTVKLIPSEVWKKTEKQLPECGRTASRKSGILHCRSC